MKIYGNKIVSVTAHPPYDEFGREADVAEELIVAALIGFKQFAQHMAEYKDQREFLGLVRKSVMDGLAGLDEIIAEKAATRP